MPAARAKHKYNTNPTAILRHPLHPTIGIHGEAAELAMRQRCLQDLDVPADVPADTLVLEFVQLNIIISLSAVWLARG